MDLFTVMQVDILVAYYMSVYKVYVISYIHKYRHIYYIYVYVCSLT